MRALTTILLLGSMLMAAPLYAQEHQHGQQPEDPGGMMQMQEMMPGPMMILQLREPLGLTPAQVARLEAVRDRGQGEHQPHMQAAMRAMQEAQTLLEGVSPDLSHYEAKLREAADHHVQAHLPMARAWLEAREALTPEQRSNVVFGMKLMQQTMRERMQGMMGEMRPGMMQGGPGDPGGPPVQH